jgi:hypothetical protein
VLSGRLFNAAIFWDIAPCSQHVNRRFGRNFHLHLQDGKSVALQTNAQQVPKPSRNTAPYPKNGNIHNYRCGKLKFYMEGICLENTDFPQVFKNKKLKTKLRGLSPRTNCTDRAIAACRLSQWQLFLQIEWCRVVSTVDPLRK